jgi:hypothetical protein
VDKVLFWFMVAIAGVLGVFVVKMVGNNVPQVKPFADTL